MVTYVTYVTGVTFSGIPRQIALADLVRGFHHERVAHAVECLEHHGEADALVGQLHGFAVAARARRRAHAAFRVAVAHDAAGLADCQHVAGFEAGALTAVQRDHLERAHPRVVAHGDDACVDVGGRGVRHEVDIHV